MTIARIPAIERVMSKAVRMGPDLVYTGSLHPNGYGSTHVFLPSGVKKQMYVHRIAYEDHYGPVPTGHQVDHVKALGCLSRACVDWRHLEAVTQQENLLRGDTIAARHAATEFCPAGHPYAGENLYVSPEGWRQCKTCRRVANSWVNKSPEYKARHAKRGRLRQLARKGA